MLSLTEFCKRFDQLAPLSTCVPRDERGLVFTADTPPDFITGIACVWNVECDNISAAAKAGCNLMVCHEQICPDSQVGTWFGYWYDGPEQQQRLPWQQKEAALSKAAMTVYRSHSNWDALAVDGVPDQAVAALGIDGLRIVNRSTFFKVHELPYSMTVRELARHARDGLNCPPTRIFGQGDRPIKRFAFLIGGFGNGLVHAPQVAAQMGAECLIIGEMQECFVLHAHASDLPVIETLHSASEIPAIRRQADCLRDLCPEVSVHYFASGMLPSWEPV